jgi:hypothetical protein
MKTNWMARLLALAAGAALLAPAARAELSDNMHQAKNGDHTTVLHRVPGSPTAFTYRTFGGHAFSTDFDGSPWAYHPHGAYSAKKNPKGQACDWTANAGKPGNYYGIVTKDGKGKGDPIIQGSSDPAPGFYVSPSALQDTSKASKDPARNVDAVHVDYISLPGELFKGKSPVVSKGDFATVINWKTQKVVHAIVGDVGPGHKIGEGSARLGADLGISTTEIQGSGKDARCLHKEKDGSPDVVWIVYPKTKHSPAWPVSASAIQSEGEKRFEAAGGLEKVKDWFPAAAVQASAKPKAKGKKH